MLLVLTKIRYLWRETWLGLQRGGWMNWAAISTVTVLLFLFGMSLQTSWQLDALLHRFGTQVEVMVYVRPEFAGKDLLERFRTAPDVEKAILISRDEAWRSLLQELGMQNWEEATQQLEGNPLVDEIRLQVTMGDRVPTVAQWAKTQPEVEEVTYLNQALQRLEQLRQGWRWLSWTLIMVLSLAAIAVVMTTLRLIAIARQQEIEILQLVGATKTWIYLPFMLQGMGFGLGGGSLAWALILGLTRLLRQLFAPPQPRLMQWLLDGLSLNLWQAMLLPLALMSLGMAIGLVGSLFALRRVLPRA